MTMTNEEIAELERKLAEARARAKSPGQNALPSWAMELAEQYRGGTINQFLITGNISDVVPLTTREQDVSFVSIRRFLAELLFAQRDSVIFYDPAKGISFEKTETYGDFHRVAEAIDAAHGTHYARGLPRDPRRALYLIGRYIESRIDQRGSQPAKSIAVIIDYTQLICSEGPVNQLSFDEQAILVTLLRWASNPRFLEADLTICLLAENLAEVNNLVVKSPYVGKITVELPNEAERQTFLEHCFREKPVLEELCDVDMTLLAERTAGLTRINIQHLLSRANANQQKVNSTFINVTKKELIEKECYGLLEFLSPRWTLDMVSGHDAAKTWLNEDAELIKKGRSDCLPMGYLICGPVGTGKSFLVECYTGEIGIPCVKLKNFRSQWQGVTEGNWQKILQVLKATGPVGVIIDEADAAVGNRNSGGDSGTSSRIFSMLAAQMGDTRYRGKILWFLITCRPDLLPIDLKRQGRAEVHIPLFYPETSEERERLVEVIATKINMEIRREDSDDDDEDDFDGDASGDDGHSDGHVHGPDCDHDHSEHSGSAISRLHEDSQMSGADIEGIVVRAKRRAVLGGRDHITEDDLEAELENFMPPQYPAEVQLQILAAVLECSDRSFLPTDYRESNISQLQNQFQALKLRLEGR